MEKNEDEVMPPIYSLMGRVGTRFDVKTMVQGFACNNRGAAIMRSSETCVQFRISGRKRVHYVELRQSFSEEPRLRASCTCGKEACPHVWAALMEVDKRFLLKALRLEKGPIPLDSSQWEIIVHPKCDLCMRIAHWRHPHGGQRCRICKRPEASKLEPVKKT